MKRPWMPLYVADFILDTVGLDAADTGAYLLLIMHYWVNEELPDDDRQLARIARMTLKQWNKARPTIERFFSERWRHQRIDDELLKVSEISNKRKDAALQKHSKSSASAEQLQAHSHPQSQRDVERSAQAREPAKPLSEKVNVSAEKRAAIALGLAFVQAAGFADYADAPSCLYGAGDRAALWIENGWSEEMILAVTRIETEKRGVVPVSYYEKAFATAASKAARPLPTVNVLPAETVNVARQATSPNRNVGDALAALTRRLEQDDGAAGHSGGDRLVKMLAQG